MSTRSLPESGRSRQNLRGEHVNPGIMRILDHLNDTPAQVMTDIGGTLLQTRLAVALLGDQTAYTGRSRSLIYRWFTDPAERGRYAAEDHLRHGRVDTAQLRVVAARQGRSSPAGALVERLRAESREFASLWLEHEVGLTYTESKRIVHSAGGTLTLHCQTLQDPDHSQSLLVLTAGPGSEDHDKLELLSVIRTQKITG